MATTCCSILPLPFTGRRVPSRPGRGTTKERRDKIVCFGCSLRPNQNRDALAEKRYPFPLRKRASSPLCKVQFFHCVSNYLSLSMDYPQVFENEQQRDYNDRWDFKMTLGTRLENGWWCRCKQENSVARIGLKMRQKRRTRNSCTHDQWYKITVSCKQRISSARLMAAWVAVRASRVLHKQWDSNFGLVEQTNRVNRPRIDEMEIGESGEESARGNGTSAR